MAFCLHLGYSEKEAADFGLAALFHDIGKSEIDDRILNKPAMLTIDEFAEIKKHPAIGYESLAKLNLLTQEQLYLVLQHHEDINGSGYPQGLKGSEIHKYARIARIIDTYDALTTRRSYKDAFSPGEAFQVMEEKMKPALDEKLLKCFWVFMKVEERPTDPLQGIRFAMDIGSQVQIQFSENSDRFNAKFIGMDPGAYLILNLPNLTEVREQIFRGQVIVVRYMTAGTVYGFESKVITLSLQPAKLLFLVYPEKIQTCEIRKHARFDCTFYCRAVVSGSTCRGIITNISLGGCQYVTDQLDEEKASRIKLEEKLLLNFQTLDGHSIESLAGEVRNVRRNNHRVEIGVRFMDMAEDVKNTLIDGMKSLALAGRSLT
jgi:c-di-GMP-binding flagellar brake protein YcgR